MVGFYPHSIYIDRFAVVFYQYSVVKKKVSRSSPGFCISGYRINNMAARLARTVTRIKFGDNLQGNAWRSAPAFARNFHPQTVATRVDGTIPPVPLRKRLSMPVVFTCIGTGLFIGQTIAKKLAAFLEEMELFVPEDDDD